MCSLELRSLGLDLLRVTTLTLDSYQILNLFCAGSLNGTELSLA